MEKVLKAGNYNIYFTDHISDTLSSVIDKNKKPSKVFVLADENSLNHCLPKMMNDYIKEAEVIEIESGEEQKTIEICHQVWTTLNELGADRDALLINLGGGVIGDLGGFIASTYKRGISFINIPTSLLAQVDASVGGKTGIDVNGIKNMVGVFANPTAVIICSDFLKTLSQRQLISGFAEVVKHCLISDRNTWTFLKELNPDMNINWSELVYHSVTVKQNVVSQDPYEKNLRKMLNFGHTIGHALESYSLANDEEPILHGEAIAIGMICESYISYKMGLLPYDELENISSYIHSVFPEYIIAEESKVSLLEIMLSDKKNSEDRINVTLLKGIGNAAIDNFPDEELILKSLEYYQHTVVSA